ncbi:MAG TPA: DUF2167 domain-containing protein [Verrucomicrobiae bacterium]
MNQYLTKALLCLTLLLGTVLGHAQATTDADADAKLKAYKAKVEELLKSLKYQQGEIDLPGGIAKLTVPKEFSYLSPDDAETVLVKLWGNPATDHKLLGLLLPAGMTPMSSNSWVVTIDYTEDGYVKDDDAAKINYDDLLKKMQGSIAEENPERQKAGYPQITLVGWAAPPHYDATTHKLYWAKNLKFEGEGGNTLNYSIRILGRKGVLELNAVADLQQFKEIDQQTPQILSMVDFKEGSRYTDFDAKTDKIAKYGIATLIGGGALAFAAKAGLLKGLWLGLLAFKKFIIVGVIAAGAFIRKLFARKS